MASDLRSDLAAVRASASKLDRLATQSVAAAQAAGDGARAMLEVATGSTDAGVRRWLDRIAGNADGAVKTATGLQGKARRVGAIGDAAADDPGLGALVQSNLDYARGAVAAPGLAQGKLSAAYQWATMAAGEPIIADNPGAKPRLARVIASLKEAYRLMDDAKPAADAQLGAVKALVDAINAPLPPPPPPVLSRLDARAEDTRVVEGDAGAGAAIGFVVSRTGPLDGPCSVAWTLGGEAKPGDFVEGAAFAGKLAWDAGDGAEQRIEMVLDPDRVAEGNETAILTLAQPDGATIGQATAQVVILNDDQPPPVSSKGYDEDLPYGGIMLGAACQDGHPATCSSGICPASAAMRWSCTSRAGARSSLSRPRTGWTISRSAPPPAATPTTPSSGMATARAGR
jgi:hypothetical protein